MVSGNLLSLILVGVLSVSRVGAQGEGELKQRLFDDCILREADGRIWLQKQTVYLGMVGVIETPPFCLSEDLTTKFTPLVSKVSSSDEHFHRGYHSFDYLLREQKGHLILVSMSAVMRAVYDEQAKEVARNQKVSRPEYYEIVKGNMVTAEFVGADWIEAWRTADEALQEIVTESKTPPSKEKGERLAVIFDKGEHALNKMIWAKQPDDFQSLVSRVDPNTMLVQVFARGVTYRWQEWLERFAARLGVKLHNPLPVKPTLSITLEALANSESLAEFRAAKKEISLENLELLYALDLGQKLRALETEHRKDYNFEALRNSAKELLLEMRAWKERSDSRPEASEKQTVEEFGLVLRPASAKLLTEKLILLGIEVESTSAEFKDVGLRAGDIIIDYDRVNDVVMGWHSFSGQIRMLANRMQQGHRPRVIREDRILDLPAGGRQ